MVVTAAGASLESAVAMAAAPQPYSAGQWQPPLHLAAPVNGQLALHLTVLVNGSCTFTLHYLLHTRSIPAESVCWIQLGTTRGQHCSSFPTVILHLDTGKSLRLVGTRGGALRLYRALALACPDADRP